MVSKLVDSFFDQKNGAIVKQIVKAQHILIGIIDKRMNRERSSLVVLERIIAQKINMDNPVAFIIVNGIFTVSI